VLAGNTEGGSHQTKNVIGVDLGADKIGRNDLLRVQLLKQTAHEQCLACADLPGNDNKTLVLMQTVLEISHRAAMPATTVEKRGVRIQLERLAPETEIGFVH
jgi:hypothetical protein